MPRTKDNQTVNVNLQTTIFHDDFCKKVPGSYLMEVDEKSSHESLAWASPCKRDDLRSWSWKYYFACARICTSTMGWIKNMFKSMQGDKWVGEGQKWKYKWKVNAEERKKLNIRWSFEAIRTFECDQANGWSCGSLLSHFVDRKNSRMTLDVDELWSPASWYWSLSKWLK